MTWTWVSLARHTVQDFSRLFFGVNMELIASRITTTIFLLSALATAQSTIIVDAAGGGHFTAIQPAVDAAQPGDLIRIKHGEYQGATINKALRLLGEPADAQRNRVNIVSPIEVSAIPPNQSFIATDLSAVANGFELVLRDCQGSVHLDGVCATPEIRNCAYVTINRSGGIGDTFFNPGEPALVIVDSWVVITDSNWFTSFTQPVIRATRSRLTLVKNLVFEFNDRNAQFPSSPIVLEDSILIYSGDTAIGVHCAAVLTCPPAIQKIGTSTDTRTFLCSFTLDPDDLELVLRAPPQTPIAILANLPAMPLEISPGATLYLQVPTSLVLFFGQTGFDFPRLPIPFPTGDRFGIPITFQAGILDGNGVKLTHPYTMVF